MTRTTFGQPPFFTLPFAPYYGDPNYRGPYASPLEVAYSSTRLRPQFSCHADEEFRPPHGVWNGSMRFRFPHGRWNSLVDYTIACAMNSGILRRIFPHRFGHPSAYKRTVLRIWNIKWMQCTSLYICVTLSDMPQGGYPFSLSRAIVSTERTRTSRPVRLPATSVFSATPPLTYLPIMEMRKEEPTLQEILSYIDGTKPARLWFIEDNRQLGVQEKDESAKTLQWVRSA